MDLPQIAPAEVPIGKKSHGVFYTPQEVTRILCDWAVRSECEFVLEPSFGGCNFLRALRDRLVQLGSANPAAQIYGCDVDPAAFKYLKQEFSTAENTKQFILRDFLDLRPDHFSTSAVDVVIGNPPYVSHHHMKVAQRQAAAALAEEGPVAVGGKASLWAYFVIHSFRFLRVGGRMAWVLPGSFLYADYASTLRERLGQLFTRSLAIKLEQRLFLSEGTEESTVVLLAEGWQGGQTSPLRIVHAPDLSSLTAIVAEWGRGVSSGVPLLNRSNLLSIETDAGRLFTQLQHAEDAAPLNAFADIRIGIVTGANKFFVVDQGTAARLRLPERVLRPILAKFGEAKGLMLTDSDLAEVRKAGRRCLLIDTRGQTLRGGALKRYLSSFPTEELQTNSTFAKRPVWHQCDDGQVPSAFFPSMHASGPVLVLNNAGVTATNSLYRVYFKGEVGEMHRRAIAISLLSTFSQLSAEIEGRHYGSGGLKHEPSEAGRIRLIIPRNLDGGYVATAFARIDTLLRNGRRLQAQAEADAFILRDYKPAERNPIIEVLRRALDAARTRRRRPMRVDSEIPTPSKENAA